jgi:hypothetical protein
LLTIARRFVTDERNLHFFLSLLAFLFAAQSFKLQPTEALVEQFLSPNVLAPCSTKSSFLAAILCRSSGGLAADVITNPRRNIHPNFATHRRETPPNPTA